MVEKVIYFDRKSARHYIVAASLLDLQDLNENQHSQALILVWF